MIKKNQIQYTLAVLLVLSCILPIQAQTLFNDKLTETEQMKLLNGEILIRNIGKANNMCLNPVNEGAKKVIESITDLKPKYLAEVIQVRPYSGNKDLIDNLQPVLLDIENYVGIPYYSVQHERYFDLYSSAEIVTKDVSETEGSVNADLTMSPFGHINFDIDFEKTDDDLFYTMTNTNKVKYRGITVVNKENMKSIVYVFKYQDNLVLYGIGGVDAMTISFLRDRIDTAFINRIKSFCQFIFEEF